MVRSNTPPPAPHAANLVAKTVTKGQGNSMVAGRISAAKVQANADKVAAMNAAEAPAGAEWVNSKLALPGTWVADAIKGRAANGPAEFRQVAEASTKGTTRVLVFTDGTARSFGVATKVFVAPATKVQAKPTPEARVHGTTCLCDGPEFCPGSAGGPEVTPDPKPSAAQRAAKVRAEGATVHARKTHHLANATPPVVDQPPADAPPELLEQIDHAAQAASADRTERLALAKVEHATLQAWIKNGENPPRPATPNLDAMNAEHAAGGSKAKAPKATTGRTVPALYAEAKAVQKAASDKRGPGERVPADQLAAVATELRGLGLTQGQALEVAYWLRKLAVSRGTWAKAWEATTAAA